MVYSATHIVWFKRDLRLVDHAPLVAAASAGPILPLYVVEPAYWQQDDTSARQFDFLHECLDDLCAAFQQRGIALQRMQGDMVGILAQLQQRFGAIKLYSHEETGNGWTYQRDKAVKRWCREVGVDWQEFPQHGVVRRLDNRDGWAAHWDKTMGTPVLPIPEMMAAPGLQPTPLSTAKDLGLKPDPCPKRQKGGRQEAQRLLDSFLNERGETYRSAMANPIEGEWACSRVSAHLSLGCLSMRETAQAVWHAQREARISAPKGSPWPGALQSFSARLHWHCHFIQKLEDEPTLEFQNLHPAYNGLRPDVADAARLKAWADGQTGLPFLDACMRFLNQAGWLNFRMRAMVMAVASYHLWLPWRAAGLVLARRFVDYEPGIHWSQVQMQSGTTGINTPRIYNPVKQGQDQDPQSVFTRRWVPELGAVPDDHVQTPWTWSGAAQVLGKIYPHPIVDPKTAARDAREKIWAVRKGGDFRSQAQSIVKKHGSRKNNDRDGGMSRRRPKPRAQRGQLTLFE